MPPCRTRPAGTHEYIAGETLAREYHVGMALPERTAGSVDIDGSAAVLSTRRLGDGRTLSGPAQADGM